MRPTSRRAQPSLDRAPSRRAQPSVLPSDVPTAVANAPTRRREAAQPIVQPSSNCRPIMDRPDASSRLKSSKSPLQQRKYLTTDHSSQLCHTQSKQRERVPRCVCVGSKEWEEAGRTVGSRSCPLLFILPTPPRKLLSASCTHGTSSRVSEGVNRSEM